MRRFGGRQDWGWRTSEQKDMHALVLCSRYGEIRPPNLAGYSEGEIRREARSEGSGLASHCGFPFDAFSARNHRSSSSSFVVLCHLLSTPPTGSWAVSLRVGESCFVPCLSVGALCLWLVDIGRLSGISTEYSRKEKALAKDKCALDVHGRVQGPRLSVESAIRSLRLL